VSTFVDRGVSRGQRGGHGPQRPPDTRTFLGKVGSNKRHTASNHRRLHSSYLQMLAAATHVAEGLAIETLTMLNVDKSVVCSVRTATHNRATGHFVSTSIRNEASMFCRLEQTVLNC
jgi:hypothetical protein